MVIVLLGMEKSLSHKQSFNTLRIVLGDQLTEDLASLVDCDKNNDLIFMCEVWDETQYVKHHKKKIILIFSAMRHFAEQLKQQGFQVVYTTLTDPKNTQSFTAELTRLLEAYQFDHIHMTEPSEYRVLELFQHWSQENQPIDILPDTRFLCNHQQFQNWAKGKKQLRMEFFYREMRKRYNILMRNDKPIGEHWNYDADNQKPNKKLIKQPKPFLVEPDTVTQEVIALVEQQFTDHFGDAKPFTFATQRQGALKILDYFIDEHLAHFGTYQDMMLEDEPWLFHSHISFYLNIGLLKPLECIQKAEQVYHEKQAPLNAVEGFIRQILGWREYVRGIYWLKMPDYHQANFLQATKKLPSFYWSGDTPMNCLKQSIKQTKELAYAHHIQRLMVLGNFALLIGVQPKELNEWFLAVYADAFEWVEMPNVTGMVLFADGGLLASKPYAASGNYINKMSNYCKNCTYNVKQKTGKDACPFNYLYWHFLQTHQEKLKQNPRMSMIYRLLAKKTAEDLVKIQQSADNFIANLYDTNS